MPQFQHLPLVQIVERRPFIGKGGGPKKGDRAKYNLEHRQEHYDALTSQIELVKATWKQRLNQREANGLPELPDKDIIPLFLHIDLAKDIESLKSFGIEIISEEEDGYIIGANSDNFATFGDRLEQFLNESNRKFKDSAATILEVISEPTERLKRILSSNLLAKWDRLEDEREISVYIAMSSYLKTPNYPTKTPDQTEESYQASIERWKVRNRAWEIAKDALAIERQTAFENFIRPYNAVFVSTISQYAEFDDGFGCKIRISGRGLKDLAITFPFIFNIEEHDPLYSFQGTQELEQLLEIEIIPPSDEAPKVCVIDSGVQEGHRLLAPAIDGTLSVSFVPGDTDTFDKVGGGGHGTRVAGAILYPTGVAANLLQSQAPFWIQNARILNDENLLSSNLNEADVMRVIVQRFSPTRIFNLSVARSRPESHTHMPLWSATIDQIMWQNDVLFCIAAGNIPTHSNNVDIPGVLNYLQQGNHYPDFLKDALARITNPAHSCFALTVGSIADSEFEDDTFRRVADKDLPSSFSRSGLGLWGMIKPDVVEYGGDYVRDKAQGNRVITHEMTSPYLIRSTRDNGPAMGRDAVGTSFTTPKVTHIAATLQQLYPNDTCLLYRALIVQSARIPAAAANITDFIHHYGYGIPDISRATTNTPKRVTLYDSSQINPKNSNIYLIKIPPELNRPGYDLDVLIEVTLSFKAEPRITRRKTSSYLSAWLDWETSRKGEDQRAFSERILASNDDEQEQIEEEETPTGEGAAVPLKTESFSWTIGSKGRDGDIQGVKRQDSSVQKDWCVEKSNQLPNEFLLAVKGHKGWEKDLDKQIPYSIVVSFEILNPEIEIDIYNMIRIVNEVEVENEQRIQTLV